MQEDFHGSQVSHEHKKLAPQVTGSLNCQEINTIK